MADGRSTSQEVQYHNSTSYQQYPIRDGHPPQPPAYTTSTTLQSSETMQQPMTKPSTNHIGNAVSSQTSGLSKVSSTGEMDTDNDELFGEKILQNRHVAFPPAQTPNTIIPNSTSHLQTILPQSTTGSQLTHPQNSTSSASQQLNTTASSDTDNSSQVRGVQRNNSIPNGSHDVSSIPQHPPVSPNHESTRMMQIPVNTVVPVSIAVDMTSTTNGQQQVVTKKKGRFKFVEQVPPIQRTSNDNLMINEGTAEQRPQQHVAPVTSMMPSSSNSNLQVFPVPSQLLQSNLPPSGPPEIQPQILVNTPSVQKKGRFVVTTLPTPVALTNGSIAASSVQQHQPLQQQVHVQQPITEQTHHHLPGIPTSGTTHNVDATHTRRPSDDITNTFTNIAIQHATTQYMYHPTEGMNAPMNGPLVSSYPPPPPPPQATLAIGQSPGHTLPHPNSNSENNSPITSQSSSYMPGNTIIDESMVQAAVVHYDTIQGSLSLPTSRQVSPKVISKPIPARHNTTGMAITTNGTSGSGTTTSNSNNNNNNNNSNNNANNNNSSFLLAAPSQRLQQQQQQQPPGFGKMLYFLDQMKLEVTEADQSIKNLQTEMKCLKEKNKELEAKARDMERKFNQEKALREVAETRVKALRKKIRVYESSSNGITTTTTTTPATTSTNGSSNNNNNNNNAYNLHQHHPHHNPNETSIDMGYGGHNGVSSSHTTRDDESVGTNQTYDKQPQQIYQQQQPPPSSSYSDQIQ